MRVLRVFPRKTSYTPMDALAFYPQTTQAPMFGIFPEYDEIRISCSFTWDRKFCLELQRQYQTMQDKPVSVGGPAFGSVAEDFTPGMYMKPNIIFTSRGCLNSCPWCIVPAIEGKLKELPVYPGNVIQDNNFLQTSRGHKGKVFEMLRTQSGIKFKGGLQASLVDDHFVENIRSLKISELWLACDTRKSLPDTINAIIKLRDNGFTSRDKIKCYVLCGDDMGENEDRLREIYRVGAMPFSQLYQPFSDDRKKYSKEWRDFQRKWSRPSIIEVRMKNEQQRQRCSWGERASEQVKRIRI